jgi:iron complex transport system substrate-binding protein
MTMTRQHFNRLLVSLFALGPTAALAQPVTVKHASGETTLPGIPKKTAVFDLTSLDTMDALGIPVAAVPGGNKPASLSKFTAASYAKIGTLFEPDYEAVSALAPDLIVVGGRSRAKYADLAKLAPTIDMTVDAAKPYDSARANIALLGRIFGKETEAKAAIDGLDAAVAALKAKAAGAGKGLLILTTGGRMSAYGPGSRFGMLHDAFGIEAAVPNLTIGTHGQPISFEFIQKTNPDWLFVIDRDAAIGRPGNAAKFLDNELVNQTTAAKKKQIVYLDPANWYLTGGGARSLKEIVSQLTEAYSQAR